MKLDSLVDFASQASEEVRRYMVEVTLSPQKLLGANRIAHRLEWNSISYGKEELYKVPSNKRGVYAFAVCQQSQVLPPHGYILYIGIAGRDSDRPLRDRYKDYLNVNKVRKRSRIAFMIGNWHEVLRFYYASVDDDFPSRDLQDLERQLNTALLPPYSDRDLDADVREMRRAFQ